MEFLKDIRRSFRIDRILGRGVLNSCLRAVRWAWTQSRVPF